ncbi:response regulator [Sulfurovum sp.]|uniref:response regulator transcription factor n=1 Tax=Sulfurovum sp. TaxID=1969726 RepID=UPI002867B16B|nr:response regulator [Sulfurovum sp.]
MYNLKDLTLLYIEDDEALRKKFVNFLKPKFKEIFEAINGVEALEKYHTHRPDMMVVDINLPKLDGLEVIEHIRKHEKETPILVLSAYSDQEKLLKAIRLGLSDYLVKPIPRQKLLSFLEDMGSKLYQVRHEGSIELRNGYVWKKEDRLLSHNEKNIPLAKRELIFLEYLIGNLNKIVTFYVIEELIWQGETEEEVDKQASLRQLLKRLRKKLPEELVENIYGEGYRILGQK